MSQHRHNLNAENSAENQLESLDNVEVNQIVPASHEHTVSFSKSTTASDLLF